MIVNPQEFNYRFIIGTLVAVIAILAVYGYTNFEDISSENEFLIHEKKLMQSELNEIINKYDELNVETLDLESQIVEEQLLNQVTQDSIELLKADVALLSQFRARIQSLEAQNRVLDPEPLKEKIENLKSDNEALISDNIQQESTIENLEEETKSLTEILSKAELIYVNSFEVSAVKIKKSGEYVETSKAKNADMVEVCFVIAENHIATKEEKEIYIQVLDPDNNVVADKGSVNFEESSLIYSSKIHVDFDNESQKICVPIPNEVCFEKGTYYISIFEKDRKLGNTQLDLY